MNNPMLGGVPNMPQINNLQNLMKSFQQFKQTFQGDPRQQVQNLLNSGKVSQAEYNNAYQMAQQLSRMMGGK